MNAAILSCLVEKPPVAIVDIEWHKASNLPIPARYIATAAINVSPMYIVSIQRAVTEMRGCNLARMGPTDSAAKRLMSLKPNIGNTATVKNTIPKPPTQWVIMRQKSRDLGSASISWRIVAPVVEKPDIVSKKASVKSGI